MRVLITGGAGYVGSMLYSVIRKMSDLAEVVILDTWLYRPGFDDDLLSDISRITTGSLILGDIRDEKAFRDAVKGCDAVVHLACISNDPSFDLDPDLGKSVNLDCLPGILRISKEEGVKHFIYASSSSVYGARPPHVDLVTEEASLDPLTDYSLYKMQGEELVMGARGFGFATTIIRPATVCGIAPRQRLDLVHNIFARNAAEKNCVKVFGGGQYRPGIHIRDMCRLYAEVVNSGIDNMGKVDGKIWNAGWENKTVQEIALEARDIVRETTGEQTHIERVSSTDDRSYRVSSIKLTKEFGFYPKYSVRCGMVEVARWVKSGEAFYKDLDNPIYHNVKMVGEHGVGI